MENLQNGNVETARRCSTLKNSLARNTIIKIRVKVVLLVGLYKGGIMKGYLFGLGPMLVGEVKSG